MQVNLIIIFFLLGTFVGCFVMFIELTVSRKNWVAYRDWSNKNNVKNN